MYSIALLSRERGLCCTTGSPSTLAYRYSSINHFSGIDHSAIVLLGTFLLVDCSMVTGTLSKDGCSLLYSEEQSKVSCHSNHHSPTATEDSS